MKKKMMVLFVLGVSLFLLVFLSQYLVEKPLRWIVYYGDALKPEDLKQVEWAIVDRELNLSPLQETQTEFFAYISVGEAESYRPYWKQFQSSPAIVKENSNWPGAYLVDIRAEDWQNILLQDTLPDIVQKGFDGVFLDTIDTAIYLEEEDPEKYRGSRQALIELVRKIKTMYPDLKIIPNNGLEVLLDYADIIDGVMVEDLYTHYDFQKRQSVKTPQLIRQKKEKILDEFHKAHGKPVLNLLYETSVESALAKYAVKRSQNKGYFWYLTTVDLMKVGIIND